MAVMRVAVRAVGTVAKMVGLRVEKMVALKADLWADKKVA